MVTGNLHSRAHIRLNDQQDALKFVGMISGLPDEFYIENFSGAQRANAKSMLGVVYAMMDYNDEMYLVNDTNDGVMPSCIDEYRVLSPEIHT